MRIKETKPRKSRLTTEAWVAKAIAKHGDRYNYREAEYVTSRDRITIICPYHGRFTQFAASHLQGFGCKQCAVDVTRTRYRKTTQQWIDEARKVHGECFDYSSVVYVGHRGKVIIGCPEHGDFVIAAGEHLVYAGCPGCRSAGVKALHTKTTKEFVQRAKNKHGSKYDYSDTTYTHSLTPIQIRCPDHGVFEQMPYVHTRGSGCPSCAHRISQSEQELLTFVQSLEQSAKGSFKDLPGRFEYDIKVGNILIEYHGLRWHSTAVRDLNTARLMHEAKRLMAEEHGYRYVAIYEDEWRDHRAKVEAYLRAMLGVAPKIGARKLKVQEVSGSQAQAFYNQHHLLGAGLLTGRHMALMEGVNVAACMSIGPSKERRGAHETWSLSRFATDGRSIAGAASRLLKAFEPLPELVSYVDLDKYQGQLYDRLGFRFAGYIKPDYMTIWGNGPTAYRRHKTATKRSNLAKLEGFRPEETELENCERMGLHRIYHSGRKRLVRPADPC